MKNIAKTFLFWLALVSINVFADDSDCDPTALVQSFETALVSASKIDEDAARVAGRLIDLLTLRKRSLELSVEYNQKGKIDMAEGIGGARYEQATGRKLAREKNNDPSYDFISDNGQKIDIKGPIRNKLTGEKVAITDDRLFGERGFLKSIIKEVDFQSAADVIVIDFLGFTPEQISKVKNEILKNVKNIHKIKYLE